MRQEQRRAKFGQMWLAILALPLLLLKIDFANVAVADSSDFTIEVKTLTDHNQCVLRLVANAVRPSGKTAELSIEVKVPTKRNTKSQWNGLSREARLTFQVRDQAGDTVVSGWRSGDPDPEVVVYDQRLTTESNGMLHLSPEHLLSFLKVLAQADSDGIHISGQMLNEDFFSARFDPVPDPKWMMALHDECQFDVERLEEFQGVRAAQEVALALEPDALRHIRWILARRFHPNERNEPQSSSTLTKKERGLLRRYLFRDTELPVSNFLTKSSAESLAREVFQPISPPIDGEQLQKHRDWISFAAAGDAGKVCYAVTEASNVADGPLWQLPRMVLWAKQGDPSKIMALQLAAEAKLDIAKADVVIYFNTGASFKMLKQDTNLLPAGRIGQKSLGLIEDVRDFLKATKTAISMRVEGTTERGTPVSFTWSARGFTAAFNRMMKNCSRKDLTFWVR